MTDAQPRAPSVADLHTTPALPPGAALGHLVAGPDDRGAMSLPPDLARLARDCGIAPEWIDAYGQPQTVPADTLRALLSALGFEADTPARVAESADRLHAFGHPAHAPLVTARVGEAVVWRGHPDGAGPARLTLEDGRGYDCAIEALPGGWLRIPAVGVPGYHRIEHDGVQTVVAVAPQRAWTLDDACADAPGERWWGLAVQLHSLRADARGELVGAGGFAALACVAEHAGRQGAQALAVSPAHALFAADPARCSPYSPSSRRWLNVLHADAALVFGRERVREAKRLAGVAELAARLEAAQLIDWPGVAEVRLGCQRRLYEDTFIFSEGRPQARAAADQPLADNFIAFLDDGGQPLLRHACFEALHAHFRRLLGPKTGGFHDWPAEYRDPASPAVAEFARANEAEIGFHLFLQWLAACGLAGAQAAARGAGMGVGLIGDLAVGMDPGGSEAWSHQGVVLHGLSVGAPPDLLNPLGQAWGLATYSPAALAASGYRAFIDMLRAVMRASGGIRIDHVLGLRRLWLSPPDGGGAYLQMPFDDLLRLVVLESWRNRAIVIGEDLGTVPAGLREALADHGIAGMKVLWFERETAQDGGGFADPERWPRGAVALTSTHDLPTVAGWWAGRDIDWREKLGIGTPADIERQRAERAIDRTLITEPPALDASGLAVPPADMAFDRVGRSGCALAVVQAEDLLGLVEQANLPGTVDEHPNWRRRLPVSCGSLLDTPDAAARLNVLTAARARQLVLPLKGAWNPSATQPGLAAVMREVRQAELPK
ncbi:MULTISPECIES: 4-alpha-glucanotransferase [Derxia]|uniref:4-alpha-glucanotransferase n=1 Tax=Derxia gummosa DSM 723 TaxID=1121388 RepID=A0A8B6XD50_9BURK|nr:MULTISPECIES: 4-alpha-glucanotransferase [Derxia]